MSSCANCGHQVEGEQRFCSSCGTRTPEGLDDAHPLIGRTLNDKYRILSELGSGSMGTVYLAEHIGLKKKVALKILHPNLQVNQDSLQRFQREGIAAGQFSHPNAIQIFDFDQSDGRTFYLAMEYVEGESLQALLRRQGSLPPRQAVELARQILGVLAEAHRHGIVHRDLKPENIMVVEGTLGERSVKVLDFGLSKLVNQPLQSLQTQTGMILGTPLYMSPEQCAGDPVDHRSDLYSLSLILFELIAGNLPFAGRMVSEILIERATEPARSLQAAVPALRLPTDLDILLKKALEARPDARFQSATEMLVGLAAIRFDHTQTAPDHTAARAPVTRSTEPTVLVNRPGRRAGAWRRRWLLIPAVALLLPSAGLLIQQYLGDSGSSANGSLARLSSLTAGERSEAQNRYVKALVEGRSALRAHDPVGALAAAQTAISMECRDAEAYVLRGLAYRLRNDLDTALADFRAALAANPQDAEAAAGLGWTLFDRADADGALVAFRQALSIDPEHAWALAGHGAVRLTLGQTEPALELLGRAIRNDPELADAHYHLGLLHLREDRPQQALRSLVEAKRHDPARGATLTALGETYLVLHRLDDASSQLQEAIRLDPNDARALSRLGAILVEQAQYSQAIGLISKPLASRPEDGALLILNGIALSAIGEDQQAVAALETGLRFEVRNARAETLLGMLYRKVGRLDAASDRFRTALELDDNLMLPHLALGMILIQQGEFERAAEHLNEALLLEPDNAFAHRTLGVLYRDYLGDSRRAEEHLTRSP